MRINSNKEKKTRQKSMYQIKIQIFDVYKEKIEINYTQKKSHIYQKMNQILFVSCSLTFCLISQNQKIFRTNSNERLCFFILFPKKKYFGRWNYCSLYWFDIFIEWIINSYETNIYSPEISIELIWFLKIQKNVNVRLNYICICFLISRTEVDQ
jgi:hypothetical protein